MEQLEAQGGAGVKRGPWSMEQLEVWGGAGVKCGPGETVVGGFADVDHACVEHCRVGGHNVVPSGEVESQPACKGGGGWGGA